ncbi:kinase-like domain-containing protein [Mycena belliarum]|uniref:Kinase-like domain-containing protein n=1 Tax=Mycena belliarum TaxID=1033014 RepID=A0AAD6U0U6_9AGAR|nr:kinase-like domain-containing protein [Mycena belliae]
MTSFAASEMLIGEHFWVENQPFLHSIGYQLRPRYDPNWIPSWIQDPKRDSFFCEDDLVPPKSEVLDAIRIKDGKKVVMKRVKTKSKELEMIRFLSSEPMRADSRNHTIPVLDIINLPHDPKVSLLVMMYGRRIDYPPFHCRTEFFDALQQLLEGLEFMHAHNLVHGDIATQNIIMDESRVVPKGSHFCDSRTHYGHTPFFSWKNRCSVSPVDYYYIDFELTMHYPVGSQSAEAVGYYGSWRKPIPELSASVPYNPFKVDICRLGLTVLEIIKPYPALGIFVALGNAMCDPDPSRRPSAGEALAELRELRAGVKRELLHRPIWQIRATSFDRFCRRVFGGYWLDFRSAS